MYYLSIFQLKRACYIKTEMNITTEEITGSFRYKATFICWIRIGKV